MKHCGCLAPFDVGGKEVLKVLKEHLLVACFLKADLVFALKTMRMPRVESDGGAWDVPPVLVIKGSVISAILGCSDRMDKTASPRKQNVASKRPIKKTRRRFHCDRTIARRLHRQKQSTEQAKIDRQIFLDDMFSWTKKSRLQKCAGHAEMYDFLLHPLFSTAGSA